MYEGTQQFCLQQYCNQVLKLVAIYIISIAVSSFPIPR